MNMTIMWWQWVVPLLIVAGALLAGVLASRLFLPRVIRFVSHAKWEGHDVVVRAIRGPVVLWLLMLGVYLALEFSRIVPKDVVDATGRILIACWIFSVAWVGANVISRLFAAYTSKWRIGVQMTSLVQQVLRLGILALGGLIILDSLGIKIGSLLAALGIGSLAVALGLQDTLSNLFAGMYVAVSKHVRLGDYIKLDTGQEGYVVDIGWRDTRIRTLPNSVVIIPNTKLSQSIVVNYDLPEKEMAVLVEVGVAYGSDLARIEQVTCEVGREVMRTVAGGVPDFEPMVRYHTFAESSINFTVVLRGKEFVDQYLIKHEFIKQLHMRYHAEGITIPFPVRTVHMKPLVP